MHDSQSAIPPNPYTLIKAEVVNALTKPLRMSRKKAKIGPHLEKDDRKINKNIIEYDFIDEYITDRKLIPLRNELTYPSR